MPRDIRKYIHDIREAIKHLENFTHNKDFEDYCADPMLRSAVERQFEIIGEALSQARKYDPEALRDIKEAERIVAFRNRLIHGYASLSNKVVWGIVQEKLQLLKRDLDNFN